MPGEPTGSGIPPEVVARLEAVKPAAIFTALLEEVAQRSPITVGDPVDYYVGIRPSPTGVIAGYINKAFLDLRLGPESARAVSTAWGWKLHDVNSHTGTVRVYAHDINAPSARSLVVALFVEALEKSATGPSYEGAGATIAVTAKPSKAPTAQLCDVHKIEKLGGSCDFCD